MREQLFPLYPDLTNTAIHPCVSFKNNIEGITEQSALT